MPSQRVEGPVRATGFFRLSLLIGVAWVAGFGAVSLAESWTAIDAKADEAGRVSAIASYERETGRNFADYVADCTASGGTYSTCSFAPPLLHAPTESELSWVWWAETKWWVVAAIEIWLPGLLGRGVLPAVALVLCGTFLLPAAIRWITGP